ncbi:MAG: hypothetical protein ACRD3S_18585, partial [Terracidiphilus sp.]
MNSLHSWQDHPNKLRVGLRAIMIVLTIIVMVRALTQTISDLKTYPGIDLRAKVVGARLLIRGMN